MSELVGYFLLAKFNIIEVSSWVFLVQKVLAVFLPLIVDFGADDQYVSIGVISFIHTLGGRNTRP